MSTASAAKVESPLMSDKDRVERIRTEVRSAKALADQLVARVEDQTFKQTVTMIGVHIAEIETFFLDKVNSVMPPNEDMWLGGAELLLSGEIASLRYYEEAARTRDYKIAMI